MSFRSEAEQLVSARRILNLRDDAERLQVEAHIASMRAETEAMIASSRPRIQPRLREIVQENDDTQYDMDQEMEWGWTMDSGKQFP